MLRRNFAARQGGQLGPIEVPDRTAPFDYFDKKIKCLKYSKQFLNELVDSPLRPPIMRPLQRPTRNAQRALLKRRILGLIKGLTEYASGLYFRPLLRA